MKKLAKDVPMPKGKCLNCGKNLNMAAGVVDILSPDEHHPEPGDATICIDCSHVMVFDKNLNLREPTISELLEFSSDDNVVEAMRIIKLARKSGKLK